MSKKELSKSEIFKNIMSGFQSLAIITSLPVAAYWAYKTFNATNQARLSEIELREKEVAFKDKGSLNICLLYTSPSPRDQRGTRMPSSA